MFRWGEFKSSAGLQLPFKLELDGLTDDDWTCLARMVASRIVFAEVEGVPTGGLKFAEALKPWRTRVSGTLLIVDDVLTTGGSMERQRAGREAKGIVVFARGLTPAWIAPLFQLGKLWW